MTFWKNQNHRDGNHTNDYQRLKDRRGDWLPRGHFLCWWKHYIFWLPRWLYIWRKSPNQSNEKNKFYFMWRIPLLLLLSRFSRVRLCATPETAAHHAPPSLGFSRQEHWSGLPFPSPMQESEKWKWSHSVVLDSQRLHGLQPTRLLCPWDFPGKSSGVGCHCLLQDLGTKILLVTALINVMT